MFWKIFWGMFLRNVLERRVQRLEEMEMRNANSARAGVRRLEEIEIRNANGLDDWQKPLTWKVVRVDDVASLMCSGYVEGRSFNTASAFS